MEILIQVISAVLTIITIIGLINPKWLKQTSRVRVLLYFFLPAVILGLFIPSDQLNTTPQSIEPKTASEDKSKQEEKKITLADYKKLSIGEREELIKHTISKNKWKTENTKNYINCMGDFAANKAETLDFSEVILWCNNEAEKSPEEFAAHFNELDARDHSTDAYVLCKRLVETRLKSPSSADFPWLADKTFKKGKYRYAIKSYVDSKNALGVEIRTNWLCDIQYKDKGSSLDLNNWTLHTLEFQ